MVLPRNGPSGAVTNRCDIPLPRRKAQRGELRSWTSAEWTRVMPSGWSKADIEFRIQSRSVLVVDDNQFMRKIVRNLLMNIRVREVYEAGAGIAGLDAIRTLGPDIVVLDWELPLLNGAEFVRIVRSPGVFPMPDFPIIMLSAHGERWRVLKAATRRQRVSAQAGLRPAPA